jgi:hypothetical protein
MTLSFWRDCRQELGRNRALEQAVAVSRERGRMPNRIVDPSPNQWNRRLKSICSISSRSERAE